MPVGGVGIFGSLINNLNQMGFYGFILPWLFVFAVVYALLTKIEVLGKDKNINGIIALVIAFFVTGYAGTNIGQFFIALFGGSSIFFAGILVFILFAAMFGFKMETFSKDKLWLIVAALIALMLFISWEGASFAGISLTKETQAALFMIVVIAIAVTFIGKEK